MKKMFIWFSKNRALNWLAVHCHILHPISRAFVAGETIDEAVDVVKELNKDGCAATIDILGESVVTPEKIDDVVSEYQTLICRIHDEKLRSSVSIKLSHVGLSIGRACCDAHICRIAETAEQYGVPIEIDMEGSEDTENTIEVFRMLRKKYRTVSFRLALQAYLHRTHECDIEKLAEEGVAVRLVKGAYKESPLVAYQYMESIRGVCAMSITYFAREDVRARGNHLAIGTHDPILIEHAKQVLERGALSKDTFEFQMLYGMYVQEQHRLVKEGYPMRIYVPYGTRWFPYFMRRMAERPANVWFVIRGVLRGLFDGEIRHRVFATLKTMDKKASRCQ
ncbi:MAG: proline dehydrogenase family protein [Candidatus Lloydbacteria bacterium]|nr:proline dehydrogenase family protein [Candidatus Lloydbacteria bacterium]